MKVQYINPFITATRDVFDKMVHVPVSVGRPYLRTSKDQPNRCYRISAVITLSGAVNGQVVLSLAESVALALGSGLAGTPMTELNNDCRDALAEIINMIAGSAKRDFSGGLISMSVPSLVPTVEVTFPSGRPVVIIPFDTAVGRFAIDITLWDSAAAAQPAEQTSAVAAA